MNNPITNPYNIRCYVNKTGGVTITGESQGTRDVIHLNSTNHAFEAIDALKERVRLKGDLPHFNDKDYWKTLKERTSTFLKRFH